jgi:glycosyltransferase involved in cell wall biosynthesis
LFRNRALTVKNPYYFMTMSVLYISYTGLLEPLGQSQVLQYVLGLAREHRMTLLTFEKPEALKDTLRLEDLQAQCNAAGVDWHRLNYHNKPNAPATVYDLLAGMRAGVRLARLAHIDVVHCRSYLAGLMGLAVKRATGARHVFDMRGFWPDERVDGGTWRKSSLKYKLFKRAERLLFLNTDHVVSLTRAGMREFQQFDYLQNHPLPVSVIPTCTNLQLFQPSQPGRNANAPPFILGYVGSVGSWYMFDKVAACVAIAMRKWPSSRFMVINKGGHAVVRTHLKTAGVDLTRVEIKSVPYDAVGQEIQKMDAAIFFYKPAWSKTATCPTRMGEFLACGKPCLSNAGVGDVKESLNASAAGIVIEDWAAPTLERALEDLKRLADDPDTPRRCRTTAEDRFSLQGGIKGYAAIYASLARPGQQERIA